MIEIVVDTREQKPVWKGRRYIRRTLLVGDYTTTNLFNCFAVERKTPQDLYGTITKGHVRFRNEILRASANGIKLVLFVECSQQKFVTKQFIGGHLRKMPGEVLGKIIDTIEKRYKLEVIWCNSRTSSITKIFDRLRKEENLLRLSKNTSNNKSNHNTQNKSANRNQN